MKSVGGFERVQRGEQLLAGKVAGDPEQDQRVGRRTLLDGRRRGRSNGQ
ncbi:MAG: hypothetical protein O3C27_15720 [Actinomycetota bacterium]|nr:hypothetical protein [Actinomycetota bacterium]